ncbi:MAG: T9SS type A sorting domain-containing protein, partial [Candidatus Kapaibacterium sp.]
GAYYTISARNNKYHFLPEKRILRLVSDTSGFDFYYNTESSVEIAEHLPIYPNPTSDYINIDDSHNFDRVEVYDTRANLVLLEIENLSKVDIRELSVGSYFVYLYKRSKGIEVVKFLKR